LIVKVIVTPRKGILEPQGRAIEGALRSLGFGNVKSVNVGRYILLEIDALPKDEAAAHARQMCDQLLANPLLEDYRFEVEDG